MPTCNTRRSGRPAVQTRCQNSQGVLNSEQQPSLPQVPAAAGRLSQWGQRMGNWGNTLSVQKSHLLDCVACPLSLFWTPALQPRLLYWLAETHCLLPTTTGLCRLETGVLRGSALLLSLTVACCRFRMEEDDGDTTGIRDRDFH